MLLDNHRRKALPGMEILCNQLTALSKQAVETTDADDRIAPYVHKSDRPYPFPTTQGSNPRSSRRQGTRSLIPVARAIDAEEGDRSEVHAKLDPQHQERDRCGTHHD
jgi:hypothetical protein